VQSLALPDLLTEVEATAILSVPVAEAERAWILGVIGGGPIEEWVVPAADPAEGWKLVVDAPDHASLLAMLETWHRPTRKRPHSTPFPPAPARGSRGREPAGG